MSFICGAPVYIWRYLHIIVYIINKQFIYTYVFVNCLCKIVVFWLKFNDRNSR